jgi:hypothetical protein
LDIKCLTTMLRIIGTLALNIKRLTTMSRLIDITAMNKRKIKMLYFNGTLYMYVQQLNNVTTF